jgi:hypothetical protein
VCAKNSRATLISDRTVPQYKKSPPHTICSPSIAMEVNTKLVQWALDKGVKLNGVKPQMVIGKGTGIIATRDIKVSGPIV